MRSQIIVDAFPAIDSAGLYMAWMDGLSAKQSRHVTFGLVPARDRSFRIQAMTGS